MVHDDITMMISKPKVWQRSHPFLSCRGESNFLDLSVICIFICIFLVSTSDTARTKTVNSTRVGLLLLSDNEYSNGVTTTMIMMMMMMMMMTWRCHGHCGSHRAKLAKVLCGAHDSKEKGLYSGYLRTQSACEKVFPFSSTFCSSSILDTKCL